MNKKIKILGFILVLALLILGGCKPKDDNGGGGDVPTPPIVKDVIVVTSLDSEVKIKDLDVVGYDFTKLFQITVNGKSIKVEEEYLNLDEIKPEAGTYNIICMYKGSSASLHIIVEPTIYEVNLGVEEVKVDINDLKDYDFKSLFTCLIDGQTIEITDKMVETNLEKKVGTYQYTVTNNNVSKTLTINVVKNFNVDIMLTYKEIQIEESKVKDFDYTSLFTIYQNGKYVPVTNQMIDKSSLDNFLPNNTYPVLLNYKVEGTTYSKAMTVKVVEDSKYTVTTKNVVTYPNGDVIDLKSLFEIKKDNQILPITNDMITGNIDYSKVGNNEIKLTFNNEVYTSNVEIKLGVIINYETSDTITILKGTNIDKYPFINDFEVLINGIKFKNISNKYLDISNVDFNTLGTYKVKLTLPYNDNRIGLSGVNFKYIDKTITYVVVNNDYKVTVDKDELLIDEDVTTFNPYDNVNVVINGKNQTLTDNPDYIDIITCYAKLVSEPINLDYIGKQTVKLEIYVNGLDGNPVIVEYDVYVKSSIEIITHDRTMYTNDEINPKELFTIKDGKKTIPVTFDMLTGKIDPTTPGAYSISIDYLGITKTCKVVVFDRNIKGTYYTPLKTFKPKVGMGTGEDEEEEVFHGTGLGDLVISDDGSMILQGEPLELVEGINERELIVQVRRNKFKLYYGNGVIILNPINDYKISFNNSNRPLVYFNTNNWKVKTSYTVNLGNSYVLENDYVTYSINVFNIQSKETKEEYNLALKTHLYSRKNSDSEYNVTWGEVTYKSKFNPMPGSINSFILNGEEYEFQFKNETVGKIKVKEVKPQYINKVFKGLIDGHDAELRSDNNEGFDLICNNNKLFHMSKYDMDQLLNGGCDYENNIIFIYDQNKHLFSYKFKVDPVNNTFILLERDKYFGNYTNGKISVFLDGYGTGEINFDTKQYYLTKFKYSVSGSIIDITYLDTLQNFENGTGARFTIDAFLNVLTIKDYYDKKSIDNKLVIDNITEGAIVDIKSFQVGQGADKIAKAEFFNNIDIITKDGKLTDAQKAKVIDTKKIRFSTPGFYEFSITAMVNGEKIINYYGVEILEAIYKDSKIIGSYGPAVIDKNISLSIDMYGRVILEVNKVLYNGTIYINDDKTFIINAESIDGYMINATGELVTDGLIRITAIGDANFTDYFTIGLVNNSGINNFILRKFSYKFVDTYILFDGKSSIGKVVDVELIDGNINEVNAILKVTYDKSEWIIKILSWNDLKNGLALADEYRGIYTDKDNNELFIDGFGKATLNNVSATYKLNGKNLATIITNDNVLVYNLVVETKKCIKEDIKLDNSLIENKTYSGKHTFFCQDIPYIATTQFQFLKNGVVNIISVSPEHDRGENQCTTDTYKPTFASATGVKGTYKVNLNTVTVEVNNEKFVFEITDVISTISIRCISTTLDKNAHGYFDVNQLFNLN